MAWIQTFTGQAFTPLDPKPETVNLHDIAHALSMVCRFNGHTKQFYSVAEHCVRMSEEVHSEVAIHALLHDAAEAYVSDVAKPIKPLLSNFREIEDRITQAIYEHFGLTVPQGVELAVKTADLRMLATERNQLMTIHAPEWDCLKDIDPYDITLECWEPKKAELCFLERFRKLYIPTQDVGISWQKQTLIEAIASPCNSMNCCQPCVDCKDDKKRIVALMDEGHTDHCACRIIWGDGECECKRKG